MMSRDKCRKRSLTNAFCFCTIYRMLFSPFYDPTKSYEENYSYGPYGNFADGKIYIQTGEPQHDFFGQKVFLPFGIPAGPLLNSKYIKAAFDKGFDIAVYKTVRTDYFPCHPFPNILSLNIDEDLTLEKTKEPLTANSKYNEPLSITNSFGVPSKKPDAWQEDVKRALSFCGKGQVLVLSFMGTVRPNQTQEEFIEDYALAAKLSIKTGVKILEANLSCPNIGNEGLVCYNLPLVKKVCNAIRNEIGNTPLIIKVGYYSSDDDLSVLSKISQEYCDGISAINTIQVEIVDEDGNQALPGEKRLRSGVCGAAIKWAGLDMVRRLRKIRNENGYKFEIEGVGGVTKSEDYFEYIKSGANSVMSATGAMWNPNLAQEIKKSSTSAMDIISNWPERPTLNAS